jgi:sarcosine oxidase / L-pipecolate oxidase
LVRMEDVLDIPEQDRIERQIQATGAVAVYFKVTDEEVRQLTETEMPVVVYGARGEVIPASLEHGLLKYSNSQGTFTNTITTRSGYKISKPAETSQNEVPEKPKQETRDMILSKVMPEYAHGKDPDHWRIWWDAVTPTEDWLLCQHPDSRLSNLYRATGGSFHSYK